MAWCLTSVASGRQPYVRLLKSLRRRKHKEPRGRRALNPSAEFNSRSFGFLHEPVLRRQTERCTRFSRLRAGTGANMSHLFSLRDWSGHNTQLKWRQNWANLLYNTLRILTARLPPPPPRTSPLHLPLPSPHPPPRSFPHDTGTLVVLRSCQGAF